METITPPAEPQERLLTFLRLWHRMIRELHQPLPKDFKWACPQELVLRFGRPFKLTPLPPVLKDFLWMAVPRACFANCLAYTLAGPGNLVYCEGYAIVDNQPVEHHHAWLADEQTGECYDVTWLGEKNGPRPGAAYYGIPFRHAFVQAHFHKVGGRDCPFDNVTILNQWERKYPLQRMPESTLRRVIHPGGEQWPTFEPAL